MECSQKVQFQLKSKIKTTQGAEVVLNQMLHLNIKQSNHDYSIPYQIVLGHQQIEQQLEKIVLNMKVGQIWQIKRNFPQNNSENQKSQLLEVQLVKVGDIKDPFMPNYSLADQHKQSGNTKTKNKQYQQAQKEYEAGYRLIQYDSTQQGIQLKNSIVSNLALVTLNQNKFEQSINWCQQHLKESQQINKKIVYRKVQGLKGLRKTQEGKRVVKQALALWKDEQSQNDFTKAYDDLVKQQKEQKAKQKQVYGKMFG